MRKFGLIGHPLGHSLSPQIHTRLFELSGETVDYQLYDIAPEELRDKFDFLNSLDGFNITIPHKVDIIGYCDTLSEGAQRYRSVNCVANGEEKIGYNTDVMGFTKSIGMMGASLSSNVLLIGCGGVGRMMAIETALSGGHLTIAALKSDEALAKQAVQEILEKKPDADVRIVLSSGALCKEDFGDSMPQIDLIVNATPIGMSPKTDRMPCSPEILDGVKFVFDAVYNPRETLLAKTAREKGAKAMTGMAMLVLQAVAAHEIWDGASYNKEDIDKLISDMEELV
ncbi:MAG: shikimate dehydrogenase [Oscillospiraceae bacterium]|nr:shikimate dehydrogenase [Oscillospiraceae bacterium]